MQIKYNKPAVKIIQSMDKSMKQQIKKGIEGLTQSPSVGDIKPMQGYADNRYRLRIGGYRIIYRYVEDNDVIVLYIMDIGSLAIYISRKGGVRHDYNSKTDSRIA